MTRACAFCAEPVDPRHPSTWSQVTVWVFGPKRNGACMAGDPLAFAHDTCARLARMGVPAGQQSLI